MLVPNAWPPSVHMIIVGLLQSGGNEMNEGQKQAEKWLNVNYQAYKGDDLNEVGKSI